MDGLYGTQMVCRWYIDGTNRSYGIKREIKIFVPYAGGNKKIDFFVVAHYLPRLVLDLASARASR